MKIRRLMSIMIVTVALIGLSLPVSFAVSHEEVDSPLEEPQVAFSKESDGWYLTFAYVFVSPDVNNGNPCLFLVDHQKVASDTSLSLTFGYPSASQGDIPGTDKIFFLYKWYIYGYSSSNQKIKTITYYLLDIISGNIIQQTNITGSEPKTSRLSFTFPQFPGETKFYTDGTGVYGYPLISSDFTNANIGAYSSVYNVSPFVNWGVRPPDVPDQIQLKSPLSEPVADKYNSYAVLDDRLIWISYRINGIYTRSASIENISEVYSYNAQVTESGTGTYAGQQNGYTENIEIPTQSISGSYSGSSEETSILTDGNFDQFGFYRGTEYDVGSGYTNSSQGELYLNNLYLGDMQFSGNHSGIISGASLGNIDFSGVNTGNVHFNSNGTVSLKDVEYYPVSFNHNDIFEYYRLYCMPTDSDNFVFWLAPDRSFVPLASVNQLLVNMDFYYSEFDLEGNYIRSTFHTVTESDLGLFDAYQIEEPIHAVKFYGIDFFNFNNLPFNLSSVLWQYDFEFKTWRDNMLSKLNDIYNVLANAQNMPEPGSYDQWGNELNEYESNYSNMSPEQVNIVLKNALGNGRYDNAASQIKAWINNFSIGELIAVCVFALALGTVTLTLGKKKSD